jgi:hypothetical protein
MAEASRLTQTDVALADVLVFIIGSLGVTDPKKLEGFQDGLAHMRDGYAAKNMQEACAVVEYIRQRTDLNLKPSN